MIGITGGAGFIGSHLVDALARKGRQLRVLDSFLDTPGRSVERRRRRLGRHADVELIEGCLTDPEVVDRFLDGLDKVYHFARTPGGQTWVQDPRGAAERDLAALEGLIEGLERARVNHLILRSDGAVYGDTRGVGAGPDTPFAPAGRRGLSMASGELRAQMWRAHGHRQLTILRPFHVYGPRMGSDNVIQQVMTAALQERTLHLPGDGSVLKDFVFVGDVVRMAVQARRARTEGQAAIFVIGTGKPTSLLDLVAAVRQVTGVALKVEVGPHSRQDAVVSIGNPEKAFEQLHQMPEIPLHAGLELVFAGMASRR